MPNSFCPWPSEPAVTEMSCVVLLPMVDALELKSPQLPCVTVDVPMPGPPMMSVMRMTGALKILVPETKIPWLLFDVPRPPPVMFWKVIVPFTGVREVPTKTPWLLLPPVPPTQLRKLTESEPLVPFRRNLLVPLEKLTPLLKPLKPAPPLPVMLIVLTAAPPLPAMKVAPRQKMPVLLLLRGLLYKPPPVPFSVMVPPSP